MARTSGLNKIHTHRFIARGKTHYIQLLAPTRAHIASSVSYPIVRPTSITRQVLYIDSAPQYWVLDDSILYSGIGALRNDMIESTTRLISLLRWYTGWARKERLAPISRAWRPYVYISWVILCRMRRLLWEHRSTIKMTLCHLDQKRR